MPEDFTSKVQRQLERLQHCSYRAIEAEVAQKRVAWFQQPDQILPRLDRPTPRQAFELLFFDYMGLSPVDLPIVSESETEIVWRSVNPCPTLEAVKALGLDTRVVCRAAYERSTQAFVSQLDPQLRFLRSYEEIRPYTAYCLERIVRVDFEAMMRFALEEAKISRQEGNKGYGAVVVLGQRILAQAHDTAVAQRDPSLHAEVNAIREAVQVLGESSPPGAPPLSGQGVSGAILISTCEPCPMCSSLAVWANLTTIVYGASIEETAALGKARIRVSANEIVANSPVMIEVIGGVLQEECLALYR
ncbi:MAG TPA: nucleoside deaminase [Anaerolineae bacterium]|nr:nucleoside deaminase [Anaerolineae bacterium]